MGSTLSPRLGLRACVNVFATVDVNGAVPGTQLIIRLTARSNVSTTANGLASDDGTIINAVGERARLTDPTNPALPPLKLVNGPARPRRAGVCSILGLCRKRAPLTARNGCSPTPARGLDYRRSMRSAALAHHQDDRTRPHANNSRSLNVLADVRALRWHVQLRARARRHPRARARSKSTRALR